MIGYLHQFLLKLPPETAHHLAVFFLKIYQKCFCKRSQVGQSVSIRVRGGCSIEFKNWVGLAAGFDKNAECFLALSRLGFGFVEVGTVTPLPQEGNPKPRLWRVKPQGLINQMGFNNCGVKVFKENLKRYRGQCNVPILANIGKNKSSSNENAIEDYRTLVTELSSEVDGFVVNVSSPNTEGLRELQSVEFLEQIESLAPNKPVWVKLAPDLSHAALEELLKKIKSSSVICGAVLSNTSRTIAQTEYQRNQGGYSGEKLFTQTLETVARAREIFKEDKSIIAVGGINSANRAQQIRKAGADLIEIYTAFIYQGPSLISALQINQSEI